MFILMRLSVDYEISLNCSKKNIKNTRKQVHCVLKLCAKQYFIIIIELKIITFDN